MKRFAAMLIALAVIVAGAFEWEAADYKAPGPAAKETIVLIPPHSGVLKIAQRLEGARVVKHAYLFWFGVHLRGQAAALRLAGPCASGGRLLLGRLGHMRRSFDRFHGQYVGGAAGAQVWKLLRQRMHYPGDA